MGVFNFKPSEDGFLDQMEEIDFAALLDDDRQTELKELSVKFYESAGCKFPTSRIKRLFLSVMLYRRYKEFLTVLEKECHTYFVNAFLKLCFEKIIMNMEESETLEKIVANSDVSTFLDMTPFETDEAKVKAAIAYYSNSDVFDQHRGDIIDLVVHAIPHINSNILGVLETSGQTFIDDLNKSNTPPHGILIPDYEEDFVMTTCDKIIAIEESDILTLDRQRESEELAWQDYLATCDTSMNIAFGRNPRKMDLGNIVVKLGIFDAEQLVEKQIEALQILQDKIRSLVKEIENDEDRGITFEELSSISFNGEYNLAQYVERQVKMFRSGLKYEEFDPVKHKPTGVDGEQTVRFTEMDTLKLKPKDAEESEVQTLDLHRVE